jgi:hypothetical protein
MIGLFEGDYWPATLAQIFAVLVNLALDVALLVVGLTVVRRAKKSAGGLVATVGAISFVFSCLSPLIGTIFPRLIDSYGSGSFATMLAIQTVFGVVVHAALQGLMLAALVQLSRPAARDPRDPEIG